MKQGEDKTKVLTKTCLMVYSGEAGDTCQFGEYMQKNVMLYKMNHGYEMSVKSCATFIRKELATSMRSRNAYHVNMLIAGADEKSGVPSLYWIDYISNMCKLPFAAHGYASYFCMSTMDRYWEPDMSEEQVLLLLKKCLAELKVRFVANLHQWTVKIVDKNGIRLITI